MEHMPMLAMPGQGAGNSPAQDFRALMATGDWLADVKIDGIRAYLLWTGDAIQFRNRNGVDITSRYPELCDIDLGPEPMWLDGEIVAVDGSFETTLLRDKQSFGPTIKRLAALHPCRFVAFDIPMYDKWSYVDRRAALEDFLDDKTSPLLGMTVTSDSAEFLDETRALGLEGVIVKRKRSAYTFGKRSRNWVKFKNTHRITCLVAGYTPGTGHRSDFGAMHLALIDEHRDVVPIGTVGTGFREHEMRELKARLDSGEFLIAEIECLNRTSGNKLRFPVYKGIRTDVPMLDCTTTQLDTLPVC
jgi:bifunctional non-homologous end joining protein LigD